SRVDRPLVAVDAHDEVAIRTVHDDVYDPSVDVDVVTHVSVSLRSAPERASAARRPPTAHRCRAYSTPVTRPPATRLRPRRCSGPLLQLRRMACRSGRLALRRDRPYETRRRESRAAP